MRKFVMVVVMFFGLAVSGYGGDVTGIWYFQNKNLLKGITEEHFLEIGETAIVHDGPLGQNTIDTVLMEKDGMVVARVAGTDREAYVIKVIDSDTIQTRFRMYGMKVLKRTTAEARAAGLQKNKEVAEANKPQPLEWNKPAKEYELDEVNSKHLMKNGQLYGVIQGDGSVKSFFAGPKTGKGGEPLGHITDFIPDWKPEDSQNGW